MKYIWTRASKSMSTLWVTSLGRNCIKGVVTYTKTGSSMEPTCQLWPWLTWYFVVLLYFSDTDMDPIDLWTANTKPEDSWRYNKVFDMQSTELSYDKGLLIIYQRCYWETEWTWNFHRSIFGGGGGLLGGFWGRKIIYKGVCSSSKAMVKQCH